VERAFSPRIISRQLSFGTGKGGDAMPPESAKPALEQLSYGLYVIGSRHGDEVNGMTAN